MHELSIAVDLIDLACAERQRLGNVRIGTLHVRLGPLAGVVEEALTFSFELASAGTEVEGARLEFTRAPLVAYCETCRAEQILASIQHLRCPMCGEPTPDIRGGTELQLAALEVFDDADSPHC